MKRLVQLLLLFVSCAAFATMETGVYLNDTGPYIHDDGIAHKISVAIRGDATLSRKAKNIHASVNNGIVTLKGFVISEDEKARIETIATQTQGVRAVNNELKVIGS